MDTSRTFVAFAELLQEWAELPAEGPHQAAWGAALAYEMTFGFWRGCNVRVLSSDDGLYPLLVGSRGGATLWRNRTPELGARAAEYEAGMPAVEPPREPDDAEPTVPTSAPAAAAVTVEAGDAPTSAPAMAAKPET